MKATSYQGQWIKGIPDEQNLKIKTQVCVDSKKLKWWFHA